MRKTANTKTALSRRLTTALRELAENTLQMRNEASSGQMDWVGRYELFAEGGIKTCVYHEAVFNDKWYEMEYGNCTTYIDELRYGARGIPARMYDKMHRDQVVEWWMSFIQN